jgi:hypothetical protein
MVMLNLVSCSMLIARYFHGDSFVWLPVNIAQCLLFSTFMVTFSFGCRFRVVACNIAHASVSVSLFCDVLMCLLRTRPALEHL